MFLHIGDDLVLQGKEIIGIFDFETSTLSKDTKNFLRQMEKDKKVDAAVYNIPKAFILTKGRKNGVSKVYYTIISSSTLNKRAGKNRITE